MSTLRLNYEVRTLDNQLLLPSGATVSKDTLDALISSSKLPPQKLHSVLGYGSVKKDLIHLLKHAPYNTIFGSQKQISDLFNFMETVYYSLQILQTLDYFKKHDIYTYRHIIVVFALTTLLAKDLISSYHELISETASGPIHDIGKVCVPLNILKKSEVLTYKERDILRHHTLAGFILLCYYLRDPKSFAGEVARDHHERKDGSGYPRGIKLKDPMIEIVAVADIYDALISPRPYRPISYDNRTALEVITEMAECHEIGWKVLKALIANMRKDKPNYNDVRVSKDKRGAPPPGSVYGITAPEKDYVSNV